MSATKKIINSVDSCVNDAVDGLLLTDSYLAKVANIPNVIVRTDIELIREQFVTLISGGGSGHEPAHAGFIGHGMLSAAVCGNVFASPSVAQIIAAIRVCCGPKGCLLIVKNYTGDRLNFGMAMEKARSEGLKCEMVIVGDDSALPEGKGITGGRGVAGTLFVHKVAGAAAADGLDLESVKQEALVASENVRSLGIALTTCTVPGAPPSDRLRDAYTYEVGLGIHGEPGREQRKIDMSDKDNTGLADTVAEVLVEEVLNRLHLNTAKAKDSEVAIMLNNLGSLPMLELLVVTKSVMTKIKARGLKPIRAYVGSFMTSLEMSGLSLSILSLDQVKLLYRIDANTTAPAWKPAAPLLDELNINVVKYDNEGLDAVVSGGIQCDNIVLKITSEICLKLIEMEPEITKYDTICGDGDCGLVLKKGAQGVLTLISNGFSRIGRSGRGDSIAEESGSDAFDTTTQTSSGGGVKSDGSSLKAADMKSSNIELDSDSASYCSQIADCLSEHMGGTSGALLELFFRAMSNTLTTLGEKYNTGSSSTNKTNAKESSGASGGGGMDDSTHSSQSGISNLESNSSTLLGGKDEYSLVVADHITQALRSGMEAMKFYGGATKGMRTMLDALIPAIETLEETFIVQKSLFSSTVSSTSGSTGTSTSNNNNNKGCYLLSELFTQAALAANKGQEDTKSMVASAGRSNYVNDEYMQGVPDPGAVAIAIAFEVASTVLIAASNSG